MRNVRQSRNASVLRRVLAAGCAAVIFTLGLFAASPVLHGELHHDVTAPAGDGCAIVLFADGVAVPVMAVAPPPPSTDWQEPNYAAASEILFDSPRYLLRPERGPPVG